MGDSLNAYERKILSQNGEDGILEELFARIGTTNSFFVEFGVCDGLECNSSYFALYKGWTGVMIEGNSDYFGKLLANYASITTVKTAYQFITRENIAATFRMMHVPAQFDLLSIDIDGNDYWVWEALAAYRPRVVVIEYNAFFIPPQKKVVAYDPHFSWDGTTYFGASLESLVNLGNRLGYSLIGTDSNGVNAFFILQELVPVSGFAELTASEAYHPLAYGPYPWREGPFEEG